MYGSNIVIDEASLHQMNLDLLKLPDHIGQRAIRPAVKAATQPIERSYRAFLKRHRSKLNPPTRKLRGSNTYVARPHLDEVVTSNLWRIPDGTGYVGFVGARSGDARHAHLLEKGTGDRYWFGSHSLLSNRKLVGHRTGVMPAFRLLEQAIAVSINEARHQLITTLKAKINNLAQSSPIE